MHASYFVIRQYIQSDGDLHVQCITNASVVDDSPGDMKLGFHYDYAGRLSIHGG